MIGGKVSPKSAVAGLELMKEIGSDFVLDAFHDIVEVIAKFTARIQHPALLEPEHISREIFHLGRQQAIQSVHGGSIIRPNFDTPVEILIGGGEEASAGNRSQQSRRSRQRIN